MKIGSTRNPYQRRTISIDDEVWFVGKDVCEAFGDTNHKRNKRVENKKGEKQR